jgi:hypothetical protein
MQVLSSGIRSNRRRREPGDDLDRGGVWVRAFLILLRKAGVQTVLELGAQPGTTRRGWPARAVGLSGGAIGQARASFGGPVHCCRHDPAASVSGRGFDTVMLNAAVHMFPDAVTHAVFAEVVARLVRAGELFVFHVNALEGPAAACPRARARAGLRGRGVRQTTHFFSELTRVNSLAGWQDLHLIPVLVPHRKT